MCEQDFRAMKGWVLICSTFPFPFWCKLKSIEVCNVAKESPHACDMHIELLGTWGDLD